MSKEYINPRESVWNHSLRELFVKFTMRITAATILLVFLPTVLVSGENEVGRIFNGKDAVRGQFPFQARMTQNLGSKVTLCGGSILSDVWILTAGHCAAGANYVTVFLGQIDPNNSSGVYIGFVPKDGILMHPLYKPGSADFDVALYKLNASIPFDKYSYISTISLPALTMTNVSYFDNYNATISGFGRLDDQNTYAKSLQWADVHIMAHDQCAKINSANGITENMICADKTISTSSVCTGDSGGPLAVYTKDGVHRVIGAASWIFACDSKGTAQFSFVGANGILPWIITTTGVTPK